MISGRLDRRITLQRKTIAENGYGEPVVTWADLATVWAQKLDMRGTERYAAAQTVAQMDTKFKIRYRAGLLPVDRIVYGDAVYDIGGVLELGRREGYEIHAKMVG